MMRGIAIFIYELMHGDLRCLDQKSRNTEPWLLVRTIASEKPVMFTVIRRALYAQGLIYTPTK